MSSKWSIPRSRDDDDRRDVCNALIAVIAVLALLASAVIAWEMAKVVLG